VQSDGSIRYLVPRPVPAYTAEHRLYTAMHREPRCAARVIAASATQRRVPVP
jgi:hypothetical protein